MTDDNDSVWLEFCQDGSTHRRRDVLLTFGAAGVASIAGCFGGGDGTTGSPDGEGMVDRTYRGGLSDTDVTQAEYNFVRAGADFVIAQLDLFEWPLVANMQTGEFSGQLLSDWSVDGTTMSLTMDDRFTWHNGDPVNADDMVTQMRIASLFGDARRTGSANSVIKDPSSIRKTGDYSLEIELVAELNPDLAVGQLFASGGPKNVILWMKTSKFGSFANRLADSPTESEKESVQSELVDTQWGIDEVIGNGPFKISDYNSSAVLLEKYEDHPQADNINFPQKEFKPRGGDASLSAVKTKKVEVGSGVLSQAELDTVPDTYRTVNRLKMGGPAVIPNHEHDIFGRTNVKQALHHVIDPEEVATNFGQAKCDPAAPTDAGLAPPNKDPYLGGSIEGSLITYDSAETATSLLEEEGFTRENGEWYKPDGERWSFKLTTFNNPTYKPQCRTIASQWSDFGIDCSAQAIEGSTFFSEFPNGSYDIVLEYGRGSGASNPIYGFRRNMIGFGGSSMNYPETVEAPPVGEPDGDLQTYTINDLLTGATTAADQEAFIQAIRDLAWVHNYTLPVLQATHLKNTFLFNTETFEWPPADSDKYTWAWPRGMVGYMNRRGWMQAKPK